MHKRALLVIALVAACGDDDPARHLDGGVTIDAPPALIDAPPAPVTLTIKLNGAARPNIVVHFQNADSTLVATETTDDAGTVSHMMAAGGYVTAIDPYATSTISNVYTFAGVKPGDHLQLAGIKSGNVNMTVRLPVQTDPAITRFVLNSSCSRTETQATAGGSGSQPIISMQFRATCTTTDLLAVGYNTAGDALASLYVPDVTVTASGSLNYGNLSYATPTSRMYTYNTSNSLSQVEITQYIGSAKGALATIRHATSGDPETATIPLPSFTNAIGLTQADTTSIAQSAHEFFDWGPLVTTPFTTDIAARKLVDVSDPTFDNATHTLSWTEGTGVAPDTDYLSVFVNRTASSNFGVQWNMVAPHAAASARFPTLPVGTIDYNADADDVVDPVTVALMNVPGGYDGIRANAFAFEDMLDLGVFFDVVATAGVTTGSAALVIWLEPLALARTTDHVDALRHRTRR